MTYFIHPQAICESTRIGDGTRIWAYAHVLPGAVIGRDCNICDHTFLENDVTLGDRVTVKCGVQLWDGTEVQDDVFIGPNATFTNDAFPRSKQYPERFARTRLGRFSSIGANATILPGLTIGERALVGAGAVVTRSVPPNAIVIGNPARIVGYVDADRVSIAHDTGGKAAADPKDLPRGVRLIELPEYDDMRGSLAVAEHPHVLPFVPKRVFTVYGVKSASVRGEHAHRTCHQLLVCVNGRCAVVADDGERRREFTLDTPRLGLYVEPMVWAVQYKYSSDAVLVVLASEPYDPADYIRDYGAFLAARGVEPSPSR